MLLEDETDRRTKAWLAPLCAHAEEGMPLAQAMRQTEAFPDYMTDMVALAEQTGRLQDVLPALSAHYTRQDRMIDDVRRAFAVPIALFCVMLAVVFLLITQVLPVFSRVFAQIGVCVFVAAAAWMVQGVRQTAASWGEEGRLLAEQAVRRAAATRSKVHILRATNISRNTMARWSMKRTMRCFMRCSRPTSCRTSR